MRFTLAATLIFAGLASTSASAAFKMDMELRAFRDAIGRPALVDLAVGEEGIATYPTVCFSDDTLMVFGLSLLATEKSEYSTSYRFKRLTGGEFDLTITPSKKASAERQNSAELDFLINASARPCAFMGASPEAFMPIRSINGKSAVSEFLPKK